jgi:hypothetical protein
MEAIVARYVRLRHRPIAGASAGIAQSIAPFADSSAAAGRDAPGMHKRESVRELEQEAEVGASDRTPLILFADVGAVWGAVVLIVLALALLAYRLA